MKKNQQGYVALIIVLTISVIVLGIASTVAVLSIGEAQSSFAMVNGENTVQFVEGCMEDALLNAKLSAAYTGGTITRPEGTCSIVVSKVGNSWTVTTTTTATTYKRTIQAQFSRNPALSVTSWQEQ